MAPAPDVEQQGDKAAGENVDILDASEQRLDAVYKRNLQRLMPLFFLMVVFNHLDRSNLAYAALQFNAAHGFTASQYSTGGGMFYIGFVTFMVPSNLILLRVGARVWLGALLVGWGTVATCMMFVNNVASFYILRAMLGAFEAGSFPGIWYHLGLFLPASRLTKPFAWLAVAMYVANVIGSPLAAGLLAMDGLGGLHGWQWLFMLEGIPSVLLGVVTMMVLPNSPRQARWLTPEEQQLIELDIKKNEQDCVAPVTSRGRVSGKLPSWALVKAALANPLVHLAGFTGFLAGAAAYTYMLWLPIVINGLLTGTALKGLSVAAKATTKVQGVLPVLLSVIPYLTAVVTTAVAGASAQRRQEVFWHTAVPLCMAGISFLVFTPLTQVSAVGGFISLTLVVGCGAAATGVSYSMVSKITAGPSQVVGMPLWNAMTAMGGFVGPYVAGAMVGAMGGFSAASFTMGSILVCTGLLVMLLRWYYPRRQRYVASLQEQPSPAASEASEEGLAYVLQKSSTAMLDHRKPSSTAEARAAGADVSGSRSDQTHAV